MESHTFARVMSPFNYRFGTTDGSEQIAKSFPFRRIRPVPGMP
jgi:hypothetical protein